MLALTDAGLARLAIAASAVRVGERGSWLEGLAHRLEREHRRARARRNTARHRARVRAGEVIVSFTADEVELTTGLVAAGFLDSALADSPAAISEASKRALLASCNRLHRDVLADARTQKLLALTCAECRQRAVRKIAEAECHPRGEKNSGPTLNAGWF